MSEREVLEKIEGLPQWGLSHKPPEGYYNEGLQFVATVFRREYTSSFVFSAKWSGVSKNGKPWKKWQNFAYFIVSVKPHYKSGKQTLNVYKKMRNGLGKWGPFMNVTASPNLILGNPLYPFLDVFNAEVFRLASTLGDVPAPPPEDAEENVKAVYATMCAYPMLRERMNVLDPTWGFSGGILGARAATNMDYTVALFGKRNYRKDLVKAVANTKDIWNFTFIRNFRHLVPPDWIVSYLKGTEGNNSVPRVYDIPIREFLGKVSLISRKRLLNDFLNQYAKPGATGHEGEIRLYMRDGINMFNRLPETYQNRIEIRTWKQFHDDATNEWQKIVYGNNEIPVIPLAAKIAEQEPYNGIRLYLPEDTHTVFQWGRDMSHCIGSYANDALAGDVVLLGIEKEGELIGNAQISVPTGRVEQVLGKYNYFLEEEDQKAVFHILNESKALSKDWHSEAYGLSIL